MAENSPLVQAQTEFSRCLGRLLTHAAWKGYDITMAEGYVGDSTPPPPAPSAHLRHGNHFRRLAQDLNLFINGELIDNGGHPAWKELGNFWKSLHQLARWGGDFGDFDHFSFEFVPGVK